MPYVVIVEWTKWRDPEGTTIKLFDKKDDALVFAYSQYCTYFTGHSKPKMERNENGKYETDYKEIKWGCKINTREINKYDGWSIYLE